ncbi:hypothetical protein [Pseudobacteriovorax antillogorgiicola]|uniref:Uncharacterized protein n=1 Tax=Pseudobacteriovorax antillogorgiicola TaxID=1513793 RepID=A0A1Y6C6Q3_9BACT|nr:hypothetical protein [Pseudobacteriovorax antillogorgiicola]TCS50665.1 hypothetical protein EDD56_11247 [Pseudobacteriovorax antillogorgiicola]SMF39934.1 hypothetical protein SAMN06296036_11246 [Pseudobacteriovorax antillogorgiicola]
MKYAVTLMIVFLGGLGIGKYSDFLSVQRESREVSMANKLSPEVPTKIDRSASTSLQTLSIELAKVDQQAIEQGLVEKLNRQDLPQAERERLESLLKLQTRLRLSYIEALMNEMSEP